MLSRAKHPEKLERGKERKLMDAFGWINLVFLIIVLVGYAYHKGTYNRTKLRPTSVKPKSRQGFYDPTPEIVGAKTIGTGGYVSLLCDR